MSSEIFDWNHFWFCRYASVVMCQNLGFVYIQAFTFSFLRFAFSGATQRPFRTDLGVPRYVRFRKRPIDSNDMTQIAWIPTLDEEVEQEDNLEENAIGMIGQIERMLFVEPEKDFREFLRNSMGWVDRLAHRNLRTYS